MAENYLNKTGLQYFFNRLKTIFAVKEDIPTATSDLANDRDGQSNFATEAYVSDHGGKIDVIKVNGAAQTITNKSVDITVPTKVGDLTNDSGYQTASEVEAAISSAVASAVTLKCMA